MFRVPIRCLQKTERWEACFNKLYNCAFCQCSRALRFPVSIAKSSIIAETKFLGPGSQNVIGVLLKARLPSGNCEKSNFIEKLDEEASFDFKVFCSRT